MAVGLTILAAPSVAAAPQRVSATSGCVAVGGGSVPSSGPNRATVVVDTGSGPVWSACISFSGTISGIEALERATAVITDLDPVYDQYAGIGKAVCKLRGVGTPPPDCLGKSINFWSLSVNGKVAPVGAGAITLKDGDVEGWRHGTGGLPRAATAGTATTTAPPAPPTTRPPAPPPQPPVTPTTTPPTSPTQPGGAGLTGSTKPDGTPADPVTTRPGEIPSTTTPGTTTTTKAGETTTTDPGGDGDDPETVAVKSGDADEDDESAAGAATGGSSTDGDGGSGGSPVPAAVGFVAVIAALGGGAVLIRRRRAAAVTPTPSA